MSNLHPLETECRAYTSKITFDKISDILFNNFTSYSRNLVKYALFYSYSLFHQILGVVFFQFSQALFKIFVWKFFWVIFSSSHNIAENLENILHTKWSNFENAQKHPPKFQGCLGRLKNDPIKILLKKN